MEAAMIAVAKCSRSRTLTKNDHLIDIVGSDLCIRSGLLMTPSTGWIYFSNSNIKVAQLTRVCMWVRTRLLQKLKLGFIRACLLAKNTDLRWCVGMVVAPDDWKSRQNILKHRNHTFVDQSRKINPECFECINNMAIPRLWKRTISLLSYA